MFDAKFCHAVGLSCKTFENLCWDIKLLSIMHKVTKENVVLYNAVPQVPIAFQV